MNKALAAILVAAAITTLVTWLLLTGYGHHEQPNRANPTPSLDYEKTFWDGIAEQNKTNDQGRQ